MVKAVDIEGIVILASCKYYFIRVHENVVQHPSYNISSIAMIEGLFLFCPWTIFYFKQILRLEYLVFLPVHQILIVIHRFVL